MKHIAVLGSTGSIGTQTLNVVRRHSEDFCIDSLVANHNGKLLIQQALEFRPKIVVVADCEQHESVKQALRGHNIEVVCGEENIPLAATIGSTDIVVAAIVGVAGLEATLQAIAKGKDIALANKETMVVAGEIVTSLARQHNINILPVDSEHSAIFQVLIGEGGTPGSAPDTVDRLLLTASGGPFFGYTQQQLQQVTLEQALKHPNWSMGRKVTIDSASLMNKGLEVIEAHWLFNIDASRIEVIVHPQSVIHSMVQFCDGSIKAQMGTPTMETPIQYALTYPTRIESHTPRFDFLTHNNLTFAKPDTATFPCLNLAYQAIKQGGNVPCAMNAANEVAVSAFIDGAIGFSDIYRWVEYGICHVDYIANPTLDELKQTDRIARERVSWEIKSRL